MATAELKFNLEDPDDRMEFERCTKATDLALVLWEVYHNSWRDIERQIEAGTIKEPQDAIDAYVLAIQEQMDNHNIIIDKLVI
jgi:hypothetical protein